MSLFEYLQLQPIDPQEDGTISDLDRYSEDEIIDLSQDEDGETIMYKLDAMTQDIHSSSDI